MPIVIRADAQWRYTISPLPTVCLTFKFQRICKFTRYGGRHTVTLMPGDGIGPEMMGHVKDIFRVAGVPIDFETVKLDSTTDNYDDLHNAIQSVKRNGCALKGNVEAKISRPDIKV